MPPADPSRGTRLATSAYILSIRQQPERAKVTSGGKEKDRKPIDPPPLVQLQVKDPADPAQNYLQSPYYFVGINLWHETEDKAISNGNQPEAPVVGSLVSSLHRLKDHDNADGGFFVFGDVSVRVEGMYRLKFSLFEILDCQVTKLQTCISDVFQVFSAKSFPGMAESTFMSRSFGDQGVRIRIRKENRTRKRPNSRDQPDQHQQSSGYNSRQESSSSNQTTTYNQSSYVQNNSGRDYTRYEEPNKRQRASMGAGQIYEQTRSEWTHSQAPTAMATYAPHSGVTASSYHQTTTAPSMDNFTFRTAPSSNMSNVYAGAAQYDTRYASHDTSRGYSNGPTGHIAHQPSAVNRHSNPADQIKYEYNDMSHYGSASAGAPEQYGEQDKQYPVTTLPPLSAGGASVNGANPSNMAQGSYGGYSAYGQGHSATPNRGGYASTGYPSQGMPSVAYQQ